MAWTQKENNHNIYVAPIGLDERLRDGLRGRRRLLPRLQRDRVGGQRGERPSLDEAVGADHAAEHLGNQEPARDPLGQGEHISFHAGQKNDVSMEQMVLKRFLTPKINSMLWAHFRG